MQIKVFLNTVNTHGVNNLPIPAIVYYNINTLDSQLCRRDRGMPTILYVGDVFIKLVTFNYFDSSTSPYSK